MVVGNKTFGDFYDVVCDSETTEPPLWMEEWTRLVDAAQWEEVRASALTDELVMCFAEDMVTFFRDRMAGICTDELYRSVFQEGKAFLQELAQKAQQFGVDVSAHVNVPITPSDAIAMAKGVEVKY